MGLMGLKSRDFRVFLLEALGKHPFSYLFQLLEATHIPWLIAPSSTFTAKTDQVFLPRNHSVLPLSRIRTFVITLGTPR